jgi:hypothetical protein
MNRTLTENVDRLKDLMQINESIGSFANNAMSLAKKLLDIKNPEEKKTEVLHYIESGKNPHMLRAYRMYKAESPIKGEMYIQFYVEHPNGFTPKWDGTKFVPMGTPQPMGEGINEEDIRTTFGKNWDEILKQSSSAREKAVAIVEQAESQTPAKDPEMKLAFLKGYLTSVIAELIYKSEKYGQKTIK